MTRYFYSLFLAVSCFVFLSFGALAKQNIVLKQPAHLSLNNVKATYSINFAGVELGKYHFSSLLSDDNYVLSGRTKISFLNSFVSWKANIKSSGTIVNTGLKPGMFSYVFKGRKTRKKSVTFPQNLEEKIVIDPPIKPSKKRVPLKPEHYANAFDPMSGLVVLTRFKGNQPSQEVCNQSVSIFDGKQRYDIILNYKGKKVIKLNNGKYRTAFVCTLKYSPIAGHKPNNRMQKFYTKNQQIEVFLVPFKKAKMYVPAMVKLPTPLGTASLVASKFVAEDAQKKKTAFLE